ncbi:hypothetical protein SAMIE_1015740 [Sphingobium amiense]|uniref:Uncharacterized protein n=1 Tax=Sphingobium amiense TaxID=135719 RepID=A0A494W079_9SPHN|nr:hypothetical protein [Sphingobium amiense]BBD98073.1 hypothetical protein SAMIE_1015740 [Sphingobium amiense]
MFEQLSLFDAAEAAACLWEEVLERKDEPNVKAAFEHRGYADLRATVCGWAEPVHRDWQEASANGYDDPFDFEFVPAWVSANVTFSDRGAELATKRTFPMMSAMLVEVQPVKDEGDGFDTCPLTEATAIGVYIRNPLAMHVRDFDIDEGGLSGNDLDQFKRHVAVDALGWAKALAEHLGCEVYNPHGLEG